MSHKMSLINIQGSFKRLKHRLTGIIRHLITETFYIKLSFIYPIITVLVFFISSLFINDIRARVILSIVLSFFPWKELVSKLYSENRRHVRTSLLVLLQVLCSSVSSGYSIEKSLMLIRPVMENTFGKKCSLLKPLSELENDIHVHRDIVSSLDDFALRINFPETIPIFHALGVSSKIGNSSLTILRSSCQMLSEMNAVQGEIQAENAGKNAEALMLSIMPFAITYALDMMGGGYLKIARDSSSGGLLLGIAFGISIISSALLFRFMSHKDKPLYKKLCKDLGNSPKLILSKLIMKRVPASFISMRHELFNELSFNPKASYEEFLRKQLLLFSVGTSLSALVLRIAKISLYYAPIIGIILLVFNSYDIRKKVSLKKEELMNDLPLFFCLISTLLGAGLQLPKAIEICSNAFNSNKSLSYEIRNLRALILSGLSASEAMEKFSLRIQIPEAQSALILISRYGRLGTNEALNLLELQASSCWNLCRNASRKKQEREALGLLFPMTLDFVSVLIVAMTPALLSLGI